MQAVLFSSVTEMVKLGNGAGEFTTITGIFTDVFGQAWILTGASNFTVILGVSFWHIAPSSIDIAEYSLSPYSVEKLQFGSEWTTLGRCRLASLTDLIHCDGREIKVAGLIEGYSSSDKRYDLYGAEIAPVFV